MSPQKSTKSISYQSQVLGFIALVVGLLGSYAIANPHVARYLPCLTSCEATAESALLNKDKAIADLIDLKNLDKKEIKVIVEKSKYRLTVNYQKKPIKSYAIVLGANPKDDKIRQGDKRTPEGLFRVRELYNHSEWSKFIWLDYPNEGSWRKFSLAKARGEVRNSDGIGGEIHA